MVESILSILTATLGISCMAIAAEGWLLKKVAIWESILFFIAGLGMVAPQLGLSAAGFSLAVLLVTRHWFAARKGWGREV